MSYTLICVYNNRDQLEEMLGKSCEKTFLNRGGNLLLIDNRKGKYTSCAEAYNRELEMHRDVLGDVLVFLHQDIAFDDDLFIHRLEEEFRANPLQLLGFAGMPTAGYTVSNLRYFRTKQFITQAQIKEKTEVESLDECCFAMTKEMYWKFRFDEKICHHWHLYAVNFCYEARQWAGVRSYVLPESIYHKMDGTQGLNTDYHFLWTIWKMTKKYCHDFKVIYTPCYIIGTCFPNNLLKIFRTLVKNLLANIT